MIKKFLLTATLIASGGGLLMAGLYLSTFPAAGQTTPNCSLIMSNPQIMPVQHSSEVNVSYTYHNSLSNAKAVWPPYGCYGPPLEIVGQNALGGGIYDTCPQLRHRWHDGQLDLWLATSPPMVICSVKVKWDPSPGGSGITTGYICDRSDPYYPYCRESQTTTQIYSQCLASCKPDLAHELIGLDPQTAAGRSSDKFDVGQTIRFMVYSNSDNFLRRLQNVRWDLAPGVRRISNSTSPGDYQSYIYSDEGRKTIKLTAWDPERQRDVSTDTQVKIRCRRAPAPPIDLAFYQLRNNLYTDLNGSDFRRWANEYRTEIFGEIISRQCEYVNNFDQIVDFFHYKETKKTIDYLQRFTDALKPAAFGVKAIILVGSSSKGYSVNLINHALIALKVTDLAPDNPGTRYEIKFLDPNGPAINKMQCSVSRKMIPVPSITGTYNVTDIRALYCDFPTGEIRVDGPVVAVGTVPFLTLNQAAFNDNLLTIFNQHCGTASLSVFCRERQNLRKWLEENYPYITNPLTPSGGGSCYGWVQFVLQVAYRGNFVGSCPIATIWSGSDQLAAGAKPTSQLFDFLRPLFFWVK